MKQAFTKRAGQIYAIGIQHGFTPDEMIKHLNESFMWLYNKRKQDHYCLRTQDKED